MKAVNYVLNIAALAIVLASAILFVACSNEVEREASYCLKQDYRYVKDRPLVDARLVREIPNTENYNATSITVFDSLGVVKNWSLSDEGDVFSLLNINTGEEYGSFCPIGRGPKDMTFGSNVMCKPMIVDGEIVVMVYDTNIHKIFTWNITRSLGNGYTVYDDVRQMPKLSRSSWLYALNDEYYLNFESGMISGLSFAGGGDNNQLKATMPKFQIRGAEDFSLIKEYDIYTDSVKMCDGITARMVSTRAPHIVHKRDKAIFTQFYVPQMNILDLKSGKVDAIRIKGEKVETDIEKICYCYGDFDSDDKYIYALYNNNSAVEYEKMIYGENKDLDAASAYVRNTPTQLLVFDYDGNLVARYKLDGLYDTISVCNGRLYAHTHYSGRLTEYDLGLK